MLLPLLSEFTVKEEDNECVEVDLATLWVLIVELLKASGMRNREITNAIAKTFFRGLAKSIFFNLMYRVIFCTY